MEEKQPIPLDYADESVRLEERGPVPDGYLGHRASPHELEGQMGSEYESIRLGPAGWLVVIVLGPVIAVPVLYLLVRIFLWLIAP